MAGSSCFPPSEWVSSNRFHRIDSPLPSQIQKGAKVSISTAQLQPSRTKHALRFLAVAVLVGSHLGLVFTAFADGTVKIWWKEPQGKGTKHFFSQTLLKQKYAITSLAVNTDASIVYCGSSDGLVNFWEREKNLQHGGVLRGHKLAVLCLATAGCLVFSGSADMGICVWRLGSDGDHICLSVLSGHTGPVKCLAVERDHNQSTSGEKRWIVYSGSLDKSVKMWRVSEQGLPMVPNQKHQYYTSDGYCVPMLSSAPSFASRGGEMGSRRF